MIWNIGDIYDSEGVVNLVVHYSRNSNLSRAYDLYPGSLHNAVDIATEEVIDSWKV